MFEIMLLTKPPVHKSLHYGILVMVTHLCKENGAVSNQSYLLFENESTSCRKKKLRKEIL